MPELDSTGRKSDMTYGLIEDESREQKYYLRCMSVISRRRG